MIPFRWGIVGPGRIARKFVASLPFSNGGKLHGVFSRNEERAQLFVQDFGPAKVYATYSELLFDPEIDAIYIASTNHLHFEQALEAVLFSKPVLCEKPLCLNLNQTKALLDAARNKEVFLLEGLWTMYLPHVLACQQWIEEGKIGEVVHIQSDFAFRAPFDPTSRLFDPRLGGGVGLDIGIYPLSLIHKVGHGIRNIQTSGRLGASKVTEHLVFQGYCFNGATFQGMISFLTTSESKSIIYGTKGRIEFEAQWFRPTSATLISDSEKIQVSCPTNGFGFQYEAQEVAHCVRNRIMESRHWSWNDSLKMAQYIESIEALP